MKFIDIIKEEIDKEKSEEKLRKIYQALKKGTATIRFKGKKNDSFAWVEYTYDYVFSDEFRTDISRYDVYVYPMDWTIIGKQIPLPASMIIEPIQNKFSKFKLNLVGPLSNPTIRYTDPDGMREPTYTIIEDPNEMG